MHKLKGKVEEPKDSSPVLYTRQQDHDGHVRHNQVKVALGQVKVHCLEVKSVSNKPSYKISHIFY